VKTEINEKARQLHDERRKALIYDAAIAGGEMQNPLLEPRMFIPYNSASNHAIGYTHWFLTNGKQGEIPTGDIRRCIELFWQIEETPNELEQIRLFAEILELNRKNLWIIGTIGAMPSIMLVHNTFRNVPEVAMASWAVRTPGNTAVECYAIEP
jgi:peptide/nickel transport system substrate-binding protein